MINFTQPQPKNRKDIKRVTQCVEDALPEHMEDVTVMVNEMQCFEPGCAPLETVVSLLGQKSVVFKIFRPVALVTFEDIAVAMQSLVAGEQMPTHMQQVSQK